MVLTYNYDTTRPGKGKELFIKVRERDCIDCICWPASVTVLSSQFSTGNISAQCIEGRNVSVTLD